MRDLIRAGHLYTVKYYSRLRREPSGGCVTSKRFVIAIVPEDFWGIVIPRRSDAWTMDEWELLFSYWWDSW